MAVLQRLSLHHNLMQRHCNIRSQSALAYRGRVSHDSLWKDMEDPEKLPRVDVRPTIYGCLPLWKDSADGGIRLAYLLAIYAWFLLNLHDLDLSR